MKAQLKDTKRDQTVARSIAKLILAVMYDARTNKVNLIWCNGHLHIHIKGRKAEQDAVYRATRRQLDEIVSYLGKYNVEMKISKVAGSRCETSYR